MTNEFQPRSITMLPVHKFGQLEITLIPQLVFSGSPGVDIGVWCYRKRCKQPRSKGGGKLVKLSTLDSARPKHLEAFIKAAASEINHLSERTQSGYLSNLMKFLYWCDENEFCNVLTDKQASRAAYKGYSDSLRDRINRGQLRRRSAGKYQAFPLKVLSLIHI